MEKLEPPLIRGDYEAIDITVTNPDGSPRNISSDSFVFTAKKDIKRTTEFIRKTSDSDGGITVVDAAQGRLRVEILPADTASLTQPATLACDLQGTPPGSPAKPYTKLFSVKVILDVTS